MEYEVRQYLKLAVSQAKKERLKREKRRESQERERTNRVLRKRELAAVARSSAE